MPIMTTNKGPSNPNLVISSTQEQKTKINDMGNSLCFTCRSSDTIYVKNQKEKVFINVD
jgi:hypothetical protein